MFCQVRRRWLWRRTDALQEPLPAAAADVRAPLEAVELQTGACSEQLWLMLAAKRERERGDERAGWA